MARNNGEGLVWFLRRGGRCGCRAVYAPQSGDRTRRLLGRKLADSRDCLVGAGQRSCSIGAENCSKKAVRLPTTPRSCSSEAGVWLEVDRFGPHQLGPVCQRALRGFLAARSVGEGTSCAGVSARPTRTRISLMAGGRGAFDWRFFDQRQSRSAL